MPRTGRRPLISQVVGRADRLSKRWRRAEAKASARGADCRTGTIGADAVSATVSEGSAWGAFVSLTKANFQERVCRTKPVRRFLKVGGGAYASLLDAAARYVRMPPSDPDETLLMRARQKARMKVEGVLAEFATLGCKPDGLVDALGRLANQLTASIVGRDLP
jgi:hypothetical protein